MKQTDRLSSALTDILLYSHICLVICIPSFNEIALSLSYLICVAVYQTASVLLPEQHFATSSIAIIGTSDQCISKLLVAVNRLLIRSSVRFPFFRSNQAAGGAKDRTGQAVESHEQTNKGRLSQLFYFFFFITYITVIIGVSFRARTLVCFVTIFICFDCFSSERSVPVVDVPLCFHH